MLAVWLAVAVLFAVPRAWAQEADSWRAFFDGARSGAGAPRLISAKSAAPVSLPPGQRREVDAALEATKRAAAAWPGYDALEKPLLLVAADGQAVLIGNPHPPAGFVSLKYRGRDAAIGAGYPDPGIDFRMNQDVGGVKTTVIAEGYGDGGPDDHAALFVHERFHDYQRTWKDGASGDYTIEDPEDIAAAQLEQAALAQALDAQAPRAALEEFEALRRWRYARHPEIVGAEAWQERQEGTARYVELAAEPSARGNTDPLEKQLRWPLTLDNMQKGRQYYTGAAEGRLLDRLGIPWRAAVEGGKSPYDALHDALALDDARAQALAQAALAGPEHAKALAQAQDAVARAVAKRQAALDRFDRAAGTLVRIDASPGGSGTGPHAGFSTSDWYRLPGGGDLFDPAEVYLLTWRGLTLRVENRAVKVDKDGSPMVHLDLSTLLVDGRPWTGARGEKAFSALSLAQPGVALTAGAGRLSFDGAVLVLAFPGE